jgi:hypothetical protein
MDMSAFTYLVRLHTSGLLYRQAFGGGWTP